MASRRSPLDLEVFKSTKLVIYIQTRNRVNDARRQLWNTTLTQRDWDGPLNAPNVIR